MKFSNVVRFQPKAGEFDNLVKVLSEANGFEGLIQSFVIKTGENTCCSVGIWESEDHIAKARPQMIELLDSVRDKLKVISEELGVTDPVSGPIIFEMNE